jgi:pimeloyl-ACP methyl ester carboxylesterase
MENKIVDPSDGRMEVNASLKAVNTKMKFIETSDRKIAYRSIGKGLPIIMVNRFRGNLDTWDPAFLDALASRFYVITIDYSGIGLSTGCHAQQIFHRWQKMSKMLLRL